jgi:DNA repair protein RadA
MFLYLTSNVVMMNLFEKHMKEKKGVLKDNNVKTEIKTDDDNIDMPELTKKLQTNKDLTFFRPNSKINEEKQKEELDSIFNVGNSIITELKETNTLNFEYYDGETLLNVNQKLKRVPVNISSIDKLLGGGLESRSITELFGPAGSGKTQFCYQVIASVLTSNEFKDKEVIYIDTEGKFKPDRVLQILSHNSEDDKEILKRILIFRVFNSQTQIKILEQIDEILIDNNVCLLIIDSLTALFRSEFIHKQKLVERQQLLNQYLNKINQISYYAKIPVLVTNQVMYQESFSRSPDLPNFTHVGGNIVAHAITHRILLWKLRNSSIRVQLVDSPNLKETSTLVRITDRGLIEYNK